MKGLRRYLTPFAPDQSGAAAVLYGLGGMIVILDAGGCAGNICGFDEPRWAYGKSAVFSAGLRDMDAIMGRDERITDKIADAAEMIDPAFIALIGTPVPAVIGTDLSALSRMLAARTHLPVFSVETNGMELYDKGEEKAYLALYDTFAKEAFSIKPGTVNRIGEALGHDPGLMPPEALVRIRRASEAEKNIVSSPSGVRAAKLLQERFGTPYEITDPDAPALVKRAEEAGITFAGKRILTVHQHVTADTIRRELLSRGAKKVTVGVWFSFAPQIRQTDDVFLKEEDDFSELVSENVYDVIIADSVLKALAPDFCGIWIDAPHFALSGRNEAGQK